MQRFFPVDNLSLCNFVEILPFHGNNGDVMIDCEGTRLKMSDFSGRALSRDFSVDESTVTGPSLGIENLRDPLYDNSSVLVSAASGNGSNFSGKRTRVPGHWDDNNCSQGEAEAEAEVNHGVMEHSSAELLKRDYIHVRARRGQATDSHSLAERARREKISDRMRVLQGLVPGCNKVIGKAMVLDEIINYIQSLQRQVEFLSMKLETVNSILGSATGVLPVSDLAVEAYDGSGVFYGLSSSNQYNHEPEGGYVGRMI